MRSIYLRNLIKGYWKKKWLFIGGLIVFVLIFGFIGLRRAYPERMDSSLAEEIQEYNDEVAVYDEAIDGINTNIDIAKEQLATEEEYCDNSIFMQIDPQNVQMASVQYILTVPDASSTTDENNLLTSDIHAMEAYFTDGNFLSELTDRLDIENSNYLSEIISFDSTGKTITLAVKHYDMDEAHEILEEMIDLIEAYKPEVEKQFGSFTMTSMGESERSYADESVLTTQNKEKSNLRSYRTNLSDLQTKLATQSTNRKNYIEQYKPSGTSSSPRRTLLMYGGVGVIAGLIIPILLYAIYYTLSTRIKGKEELQAVDLNILALFRPKKGYEPSIEQAAVNLKLLAQKNDTDTVSVCAVGESPALEQVQSDLTEALAKQDIETYPVKQGEEDAEKLERMTKIRNHVLLVEAGRTTYTQLEEQMQFCKSLDITIWGCVVIE
ncbi:MAG: hypothetical protein LIO56_05595 [Lachnospiraceae bacterium]|nr:hypothetical protein [Lachnospiraceae bacterium]